MKLVILFLLLGLQAFAADPSPTTFSWSDLPKKSLQGETPKAAKLLILDFWASWCVPCRESLPHYDQLQKEFASQGVQFIAISEDEDIQDAKDFLKQVKFKLPALWDEKRALAKKLGVEAIPTLIAVNADGKILGRTIGSTEEKKKKLPDQIKNWLK